MTKLDSPCFAYLAVGDGPILSAKTSNFIFKCFDFIGVFGSFKETFCKMFSLIFTIYVKTTKCIFKFVYFSGCWIITFWINCHNAKIDYKNVKIWFQFVLLLNHPGTDCDQIYFQPISHCYSKKKTKFLWNLFTSLVANTASSFLMTTNFTLLLTFYLVIQNKIKPYYQGKSIDCAASLYLLLYAGIFLFICCMCIATSLYS